MAYKLNIDPAAVMVFFSVAFLQIWNTGFDLCDGYARGQADMI